MLFTLKEKNACMFVQQAEPRDMEDNQVFRDIKYLSQSDLAFDFWPFSLPFFLILIRGFYVFVGFLVGGDLFDFGAVEVFLLCF